MIVTIKPLRAGDMPRKALVTKSTLFNHLTVYNVKSLVGKTTIWKKDLDWLLENGDWTLNKL